MLTSSVALQTADAACHKKLILAYDRIPLCLLRLPMMPPGHGSRQNFEAAENKR